MGASFAGTVILAIAITVVAVCALRSVLLTNDLVAFNHAQDLFDTEKLRTSAQRKVAIARGYLLTHDNLFVEDSKLADYEMRQAFDRIAKRSHTVEDRKVLERVRQAEKIHEQSLQRAFRMARKKSIPARKVSAFFNGDTMPKFDSWERALGAYVKVKEGQLDGARWEARAAGKRALRLIFVIAFGALVLALMLIVVLTRTLSRLYEEVRVAVRAREDVLAIVSHDLRNPLSSVMLSSAMMLKNPDMSQDGKTKLIRTINHSAIQMKQLIEDLLDFVKVEFGRMTVTKKPEDPKVLFGEIHSIFLPMLREKNIEFAESVHADVGMIDCEKTRVAQVLSNLVGNAIKFTPRGGRINLSLTTVGEEHLFYVQDSGPGIPPEQLARVFDRYWQAQKTHREGVGLGLAISKGLVDAHGGRIWAESQPGEGATFYFTLPVPGAKPAAVEKPGLTKILKLPSGEQREKLER